jgi:uncharacterized coiled-coil protein SlyX
MSHRWVPYPSYSQQLLAFFIVGWVAVGCQAGPQIKQPEPAPCPPERVAELRSENRSLQQALAAREQVVRRLDQELSTLKIKTIEQDAVIHELRRRSATQQKRLDEAIVDVVRSKAKLRSMESKAEAATTIAEAEVAFKALQKQAASFDWISLDEIAISEHLMEMSAQEFNAQNYGGALYLANQAKGRVRTAQESLNSMLNTSPASGEGAFSFAQPLPLKVLKRSNLRSGPGLDYKIVVELEKGTLIVGLSHRKDWIHVKAPEEMTGWIYRPLVGAR